VSRRFIAAGLAIEAIYLCAALGPLSLLARGGDLADLGQITGVTLPAALVVTAVLLLLFALYAVAVSDRSPIMPGNIKVAIGLTILFSATMVFVYPATAIDVFNYAVEGHVAAFDQINPLITPPSVSHDWFANYGGMWSDSPSPYGPIWIFVSRVVALAAGLDVVLAVVLLKFLGGLAVVGTTLLLAYALRDCEPRLRVIAVTAFGWNPLVQIDLVANAHNDSLVALLIITGLVLATRRWSCLGGVSVGAAMLVKMTAIGLFPLYLAAILLNRTESVRRRLLTVAAIVIGWAALVVVAYQPYWVGPQTVHRLLIADGDYLASLASLVVFLVPTTRDWLIYVRIALGMAIAAWQVRGMLLGKTTLASAAFEVMFATVLLAAHFAGWYLPLVLALAVLSRNQINLRRAAVFTLSATMTTPLWAYAYTLPVDWMNAESFHFIVVPLTFIPPLLVTLPPGQRFLSALSLRGQERLRALVASG
jgi:hypothetical protein